MWNKKNNEAMSPAEVAAENATGWLGSSLRVKGDITGTEDLMIEGLVEGQIQLDGRKLTVGPAAKVTADINARDVVVFGYVKGNVHAKGRVEIMIEDGADFKGSIEIDRGTPEEADKNAGSRAAAAGAGTKSA
jgi:cytoskeletal protein CcmA (bactofilin family)